MTRWGRGAAAAALVIAVGAASACSNGKSKSSGSGAATTSTTAPLPSGPLGDQMRFALDYANGKVTASQYAAHFDAAFRATVPDAKLDQTAKDELAPAKPWSFQQFLEGPTATSAVVILRSAFGSRMKMSIAIDNAHLISGLAFAPYGA
jgi:hypothetical protein